MNQYGKLKQYRHKALALAAGLAVSGIVSSMAAAAEVRFTGQEESASLFNSTEEELSLGQISDNAEAEEEEKKVSFSSDEASVVSEEEAAEEKTWEESKEDNRKAKTSDESKEEELTWDGPVLDPYVGTVIGPSGKETYYNLDMSGIVEIMRSMGNMDEYHVREDGCKMLGDYIMCAANLDVHPRGSLVPSSLGMCIVCDTGGFAEYDPNQLDIAVTW